MEFMAMDLKIKMVNRSGLEIYLIFVLLSIKIQTQWYWEAFHPGIP